MACPTLPGDLSRLPRRVSLLAACSCLMEVAVGVCVAVQRSLKPLAACPLTGAALPCPASWSHACRHFCEVQERQWEVVGLCVDIPPGCGQLGSGCCPHGNYSSGSYDIPFCWDADVYCAAQADNITNSACLPMPKSPEDCGAPGGPCCPATYGIITDKQLPSQCQVRLCGDAICCSSVQMGLNMC